MHMNVWYDLLVQELTGGNDPTDELLKDAEAMHVAALAAERADECPDRDAECGGSIEPTEGQAA